MTYEFDAPLEGFPDELQAKLEIRNRFLRNLPADVNDMSLEFVIETAALWAPGTRVLVAFLGGTPDLHRTIATAASEWTQHGNIALDFGEVGGAFRTWSPHDKEYAAHIRIGFGASGYWSLVGTDSVDPGIAGPGDQTMNFGGFDVNLPAGATATIRHEFGHALGFQHEHQSPTGGCDLDFRWEDDSGYRPTTDERGQFVADSQARRPGIYTVLGGPPNRWPQAKVDHNLRQLGNSRAFMVGPFDRSSIMKYAFPAWMFRDGEQSHCFSARNLQLSEQDKVGMAASYPDDDESVSRETVRRQEANEILGRDSAPAAFG